jgi:hypothetical protein
MKSGKKQTGSKRNRERKESLSKTDNEAEDEFTLLVVDNPALAVMGTVFTQPFTKIYVHTRSEFMWKDKEIEAAVQRKKINLHSFWKGIS